MESAFIHDFAGCDEPICSLCDAYGLGYSDAKSKNDNERSLTIDANGPVVNGHWVAESGTHIEGCRSEGMVQTSKPENGWTCWACHTPVFLPVRAMRIIKPGDLVGLDYPAAGCACKECRSF